MLQIQAKSCWRSLPLTRSRIISTLKLRVGCKRGPITNDGCTVTKSVAFSFAKFQAASSAKVFESAYQAWERTQIHISK